jgi:hypothetical protein
MRMHVPGTRVMRGQETPHTSEEYGQRGDPASAEAMEHWRVELLHTRPIDVSMPSESSAVALRDLLDKRVEVTDTLEIWPEIPVYKATYPFMPDVSLQFCRTRVHSHSRAGCRVCRRGSKADYETHWLNWDASSEDVYLTVFGDGSSGAKLISPRVSDSLRYIAEFRSLGIRRNGRAVCCVVNGEDCLTADVSAALTDAPHHLVFHIEAPFRETNAVRVLRAQGHCKRKGGSSGGGRSGSATMRLDFYLQ